MCGSRRGVEETADSESGEARAGLRVTVNVRPLKGVGRATLGADGDDLPAAVMSALEQRLHRVAPPPPDAADAAAAPKDPKGAKKGGGRNRRKAAIVAHAVARLLSVRCGIGMVEARAEAERMVVASGSESYATNGVRAGGFSSPSAAMGPIVCCEGI